MEELISRREAIASIKALYPDMPVIDFNNARRKWLEKNKPYLECEKAIEQLPSVKPQEPKTGHWILLDECSNSGYYCSECQKKVVKEGWSNTVKKIKYCPNCGAKMVKPQESDHKCHTCKHYTSGEHDGSCGSYICKGYSNWESEEKA